MRLTITARLSQFDTLSVRSRVSAALPAIADAGAAVIERECKRFCPVLTGRLRDSIHRTPLTATLLRATIIVAPDTYYMEYVEFGTIHRAAHPYMRPGFDAGQVPAAEAMADEARRQLAVAA